MEGFIWKTSLLKGTFKRIYDTELVILGVHVTETHVIYDLCVSAALSVRRSHINVTMETCGRPLVPTTSNTQFVYMCMCFEIHIWKRGIFSSQ